MKNKIKKFIISLLLLGGVGGGLLSCSDMLETSSTRQSFDPELNAKTDSVFYAFGIMQAMQQLADQYYFQGEMRGDMVELTQYTDTALTQLSTFTADCNNRYDSAYAYYKVINNCNYYLAHRDTTLLTGAINVVINEYAAVAAFRAWAYLQLGRNYKTVPYFTEPLTSISQIDNNKFPEYTLQQIIAEQTAYLQKFSGLTVPTYSTTAVSAGSTNWGQTKYFNPALCFVPVDVILGEMYLEAGQYAQAVNAYYTYLKTTKKTTGNITSRATGRHWYDVMPNDYDQQKNQQEFGGGYGTQWSTIFSNNATPTDVITYIPMSVNYTMGKTTDIPYAWGYEYYSTDRSGSCPTHNKIQLQPSSEYFLMSDTANFYYYSTKDQTSAQRTPVSAKIGDGRANILENGRNEDSIWVWMPKVRTANVILYRTSTVYLHLAEAFNRMGYPDAAFCILKDGIAPKIIDYIADSTGAVNKYIQPETYAMLQQNFLSDEGKNIFESTEMKGLHGHGCGAVGGLLSPYQMNTEVQAKLNQLSKLYPSLIGKTAYTKADTINAIEDILCDEYAMEFAFEGNRWFDLCRLARHKNQAGTYGTTFGSQWLATKLALKYPMVSLLDENNWYLPFN